MYLLCNNMLLPMRYFFQPKRAIVIYIYTHTHTQPHDGICLPKHVPYLLQLIVTSINIVIVDGGTFDVITSFSAVYIWSWTTAHRHPRTAIRVP